MIKLKKIFLTIILILIAGCTQAKDFKYSAKQISDLNSKYNTTMETSLSDIQKINAMIADFKELRKIKLDKGQEAFNYVVDYRILNLEAEKFYVQGQEYGLAGTTKSGFGCKQRPLIIESAALRNSSALKGFNAVDLLREFVDKYPAESNFANLSYKNALFLNATFYQISTDAGFDSDIINSFCPSNTTLEIYKEQFRKETNLSEEFINNLTYEEAVGIWKNLEGIN